MNGADLLHIVNLIPREKSIAKEIIFEGSGAGVGNAGGKRPRIWYTQGWSPVRAG
jgi:hypothetical protein